MEGTQDNHLKGEMGSRGRTQLVKTCILVGLLFSLVLQRASALSHPLCRRPEVAFACASTTNQTVCEEWSGCSWTGTACNSKPNCNQMKCELGNIAVRLSGKITPGCVRGDRVLCDSEMDEISKASGLASDCYVEQPYRVNVMGNQPNHVYEEVAASLDSPTWFVSFDTGLDDDSNDGQHRSTPFKTITKAVEAARAIVANNKVIVLMTGKHALHQTILLTPSDSNLTFQGETGAIVTGAVPLTQSQADWSPMGDGVFRADIPPELLPHVDILSVLSSNGEPMIRAQFPNKNSYLDFAFAPKVGIEKWNPRLTKIAYTNKMKVAITSGVFRYRQYVQGSNGACLSVFSPPSGYFCNPQADADINCPFSTVGSVRLKANYAQLMKVASWQDRSTGFFHALHPLKWGGWTFRLSDGTGSDGNLLRFSSGGFQEARGDCGGGGGEFYVENIRELLDSPKEFFLDLNQSQILFIPPHPDNLNTTSGRTEITTRITKLISTMNASAVNPVRNLKFFNIRFERTYPIHMEPHETPSGGDWAVHRAGALFLDGVENVQVEDCEFTQLGSHGVFVSNYARNVSIMRNSFWGLDSSAIMLVGDPKLNDASPWDRRFDLDHVAGITIQHNMIRDLGLMEVQSAGVFGSIAKDVLVERNVIFNGPRAAVVYNDLFGGNLITKENVMFNMVRLTLDHGPYNVWDRQQWLLPAGFRTKPCVVQKNFLIGTAGGEKVVDMDDGARQHVVFENVIAMGYPKFKGATGKMYNNTVIAYLPTQTACVYIATSHSNPRARPKTGFVWSNNKCFAPGAGVKAIRPYSWARNSRRYCRPPSFHSSDNAFYGVKLDFAECGKNALKKWKGSNRQDKRSVFTQAVRPISAAIQACEDQMQGFGEV